MLWICKARCENVYIYACCTFRFVYLHLVIKVMKSEDACSLQVSYDNLDSTKKKTSYHFANKGPEVKAMFFPVIADELTK